MNERRWLWAARRSEDNPRLRMGDLRAATRVFVEAACHFAALGEAAAGRDWQSVPGVAADGQAADGLTDDLGDAAQVMTSWGIAAPYALLNTEVFRHVRAGGDVLVNALGLMLAAGMSSAEAVHHWATGRVPAPGVLVAMAAVRGIPVIEAPTVWMAQATWGLQASA